MFTALGFEFVLELVSYSKSDYVPAVTQPSP
jgi:hypothetical protein